jgi:ATP-dependent helicase/nuclease subunit A
MALSGLQTHRASTTAFDLGVGRGRHGFMSPTSASASDRARHAQREAADPAVSAWVAANAGTGKTQVLTDRILRLLLAGTRPERILALTYTKTAAAEMSKRVFDRLSAWVTIADPDLDAALVDLMGRAALPLERTRARQLFASAIETPGGLKVQTIHAFCEQLLQRFPLEAGVPPGFSILDDRTSAELREAAITAVLTDAAAQPMSSRGRALTTIVAYAVDDTFDALVRTALDRRDWLSAMTRLDDTGQEADAHYRRLLDVPLQASRGDLVGAAVAAFDIAQAQSARDILSAGGAREIMYAEKLAAVVQAKTDADRLAALRALCLTGTRTPREPSVNKATAEQFPTLKERLIEMRDRFIAGEQRVRALDLVEATLALATIASAVTGHYTRAKLQRAALDFDDLIRKAQSLLAGPAIEGSAAQWVLFKLDGGLDHVLVDEAQDTSRAQWSLIESLAAEFYAGGSRDDILRTLFAVGDEKQSIYGFQGAAPEMFDAMGRAFAAQADAAGKAMRRVPLNVSFRTTAPVLAAVDHVFADRTRTPGLTARDEPIQHVAHRALQAGPVSDPWRPLSEATAPSPLRRLADRIADTIAGWLARGERLASEDRPIRAGDILVLVAKRRPFAPAMVAALKARDIPVAGADRLRLTDQIGVQDLIALGDFLVLPEDDLALATILKSPLFGLDDDALLALAPKRKGTLWQALLKRAETDVFFVDAATRLKAWRSEADFLPPYEFYAGLLDRENGALRRRLLERLGAEASDPLDEFLTLALQYDEQEPPSLQGFLTWLRGADPEIKRDMDQGRNEVRVMTVHGAKGLEAPIVFLPDTCGSGRGRGNVLIEAQDTPAGVAETRYWPVKGTSDLPALKASKAVEAEREANERNRLLYVALTRPRDRLYIAGFTANDPAKLPAACWYRTIEAGLAGHLTAVEAPHGRVRRLEQLQSGRIEKPRHNAGADLVSASRPAWASRPAPKEATLSVPLAPSRLAPLESDDNGDALERPISRATEPQVLPPGVSSDTRRFLRGTLTHALLEHLPGLPATTWDKAAERFLATRGKELTAGVRRTIAAETLAILRHETFAVLFGPDSQAEVPLVAEIPRPNGDGPPLKIFGQIDRLARDGDVVRLIDYKTNRPPPTNEADVAEVYLLQLAAYRLALGRIYPGCQVACAILWTDGARLMEIASARLDEATVRLWGLESIRRV